MIAAFYEFILLDRLDYRDYLLDTNTLRTGFVAANKEGIFSTFGYISIYLAGQAICIFLKNSLYANSEGKTFDTVIKSMLRNLGVIVCLLYGGFELTMNNVDEPSRRICNISFVFFVVSTFLFILNLISIFDKLKFKKARKWDVFLDSFISGRSDRRKHIVPDCRGLQKEIIRLEVRTSFSFKFTLHT